MITFVQPPAQKRLSATAVTYASLAPYLSHLPRSKAAEVELVVTAALRVANCQAHMNAVEASALRQELDFHRSVYGIQLDYIHNILAGVRYPSHYKIAVRFIVVYIWSMFCPLLFNICVFTNSCTSNKSTKFGR